jgi:hypothetical protein
MLLVKEKEMKMKQAQKKVGFIGHITFIGYAQNENIL